MADVSLVLWDVGGVVLSNAWDQSARASAVARFQLDATDFEHRHERAVPAFETGRMTLPEYIEECVFPTPQKFSLEEFRQFMFEQSTERSEALAVARALKRDRSTLTVALNNESRELNEYRIARFRLHEAFDAFFSSCYTGLRKPDPAAFRFALKVTQRAPREAVFLDDRPENIEAAQLLGLRTILVRDAGGLAKELADAGVPMGGGGQRWN